MRTVPACGLRSPSIISSVVVLPAPLGPSSPKNSPDPTVRLTPSTARVSPYVMTSPSARISTPMRKTLAIDGDRKRDNRQGCVATEPNRDESGASEASIRARCERQRAPEVSGDEGAAPRIYLAYEC